MDKIKQIRRLLNEGAKMTAIQFNLACNTGDARKSISVLRQKGMNIKDEVIDNKGTKMYWLEK